MRNVKTLILLISILGLSLALGACASYTGDDERGDGRTGTLGFYLETADDDVGGFFFEIRDPEGALVDSRYVPLEDMDFPARLLDDAGPGHKFADAFFVVAPGDYVAQAFPMIEDGVPSEDCDPSRPVPVTVRAGETEEVILISQCDAEDNGGLDVVVILNHDPEITGLDFAPGSKFVLTCVDLAITVTAEDPDGDPMSYSWTVTDAPAGAIYTLDQDGATATFMSATEGDYEAQVTVCDSLGLCAYLSFPIHVVLGTEPCSQCEQGHTCGNYTPGECECGDRGICALTSEGDGECVDGATSCGGLLDCTNSSDCPDGGRCFVETCCGRPVCAAPPNLCYLPSTRESQSKRGDGQTIGSID